MYIKSLKIKNFRNYDEQSFSFGEGLNIIYGANASGKTNLVESVYYAGIGKSTRTSKDKDLIKWGEDSAYIGIILSKKYRDYNLEILIDGKGKKKITLDKIPITKISDLIGIINIVFFSPDELSIVKDGPSERRRFLDISISQQKKSYFTDLVNYNKVIEQRNKLLKSVKYNKELKDLICIYDAQLAKYGARIINNRYLFIKKLKRICENKHNYITNNNEKLNIDYESKIKYDSVEKMEENILKLLEDNYEKDVNLQYTSIGAHRDDLSLEIDGVDVRKFGSQGQKRTVALSLKMSEIDLLREEKGENPILILDDVLSELDADRRKKLIESTENIQTLLTCTEYDGEYDKSFNINNGKLLK